MNSLDPKNEKIRSTSEPEQKAKKPYSKPAFRFERVFETSALSCGKVNQTQRCGLTGKS